MPRFICLNGPKKSGKDTIGNALYAELVWQGIPTVRDKFAAPMKAAIASFLSLDEQLSLHYFENQEVKDVPSRYFLGMSPRQMLISFSENWVKPSFGKETFGNLMVHRHEDKDRGVVIITDCGFNEELEPFDKTDIAVIRLKRYGTNFDGDSRGYIDRDDVLCLDVANEDEEPQEVARDILKKLTKEGFM
jgi:hypothetical protein